MDGPSFRPEVLKKCGYEKIEDRVVKILPQSSFVGMLFEQGIHYKVVGSNRLGLAQHDPYTWLVEDDHFVIVDDIYESRRFMDNTINEWILSLDEEQLRTVVNSMYKVVAASQADDLISFVADWRKSWNGIKAALKELDEETAQMMKEMFKSLLEIGKNRVKAEVEKNFPMKGAQHKLVSENEQEEDHRK